MIQIHYKDYKQAILCWQCHIDGPVTAFSSNFFFWHVNIQLHKDLSVSSRMLLHFNSINIS